jgi:uncharacterized protein (DUF488 family)
MFYRRKILLALLGFFPEGLDKIRLQKLLFLFCQGQTKADYHFVPYHYGCFSFQANADLMTLAKYLQVKETNDIIEKIDTKDYLSMLKEKDKKELSLIVKHFKKYNTENLTKYTYLKSPYFAINSKIAKEILSESEYEGVENARPKKDKIILYTIGYEGITLEEYLNKLIRNDVKLLCDVRNNPVSMKYGFSGGQLRNVCNRFGIAYLHFPELGITSDNRQNLETQKDYDILFDKYKCENLPHTVPSQQKILSLLIENQRVALTCFEANVCQCHRTPLAEAITRLPEWKYELKYI